MADLFTVDVDVSGLLAALDRLGAIAEAYTSAAARVTAGNVAREARNRVARRTGTTAEGIGVVEDDGAYLVQTYRQQFPSLPAWLEYGTKHMSARPFFRPSAQLEEGPHLRRIAHAVQSAIDDAGLGD